MQKSDLFLFDLFCCYCFEQELWKNNIYVVVINSVFESSAWLSFWYSLKEPVINMTTCHGITLFSDTRCQCKRKTLSWDYLESDSYGKIMEMKIRSVLWLVHQLYFLSNDKITSQSRYQWFIRNVSNSKKKKYWKQNMLEEYCIYMLPTTTQESQTLAF